MCGKFTQLATWAEVVAFSAPLAPTEGEIAAEQSRKVMEFAHVLRLDAAGEREVAPMRWGWPERRAANPARPKHIHVRAETIDELPTFKDAFASARGILPVRTFNEGEELPSGKTRQWVVTPKTPGVLGIAVLWEEWALARDEGAEERLPLFVMATTPPNALIATITDRMPAVLRAEDWPAWLGETDASLAEIKALLRTYDDGGDWEMAPQGAGRSPRGPGPGEQPSFL